MDYYRRLYKSRKTHKKYINENILNQIRNIINSVSMLIFIHSIVKDSYILIYLYYTKGIISYTILYKFHIHIINKIIHINKINYTKKLFNKKFIILNIYLIQLS